MNIVFFNAIISLVNVRKPFRRFPRSAVSIDYSEKEGVQMANIKSALKRIDVTERRTLRNKMVKSAAKTTIKKFETAVNNGNFDEAKALLAQVSHVIDKAAAKGVIHKNAAARKKSRLAVALNKAVAK